MRRIPSRRGVVALSRSLALESLEDRRMLAGAPWHNAAMPLDVNQSGTISAIDVAAVISELLSHGVRTLPAPDPDPPLFYVDTNGDNVLSPRDALGVISRLLTPPTVTVATMVPFSIDTTPIIDVAVSSAAGFVPGTNVALDVDINNDGDFSDAGELNHTLRTLSDGAAHFSIDPELPANGPSGPYTVRLRARVTDADGVNGSSPIESLIIDTTMSSALSNYVHTPDASYKWSLAAVNPGVGYTHYVLDMTSQTWRSAADVNKPDWRHWVEVIVPTGTISGTALLLIDGGNNTFGATPQPDEEMLAFAEIATFTHSVAVRLRTVPSEPLIFTDETISRSEDAIIAYSFDKYLENIGAEGNETWPVLLAMAKSAVRAMDTIQVFVPSVANTQPVNEFIVTGYSKRGWTTWLTAAVDDRVRAIIPGVIDVLNQGPQMVHHFGVYGFFSEAIQDYNNMDIFQRITTPEGQQLSKIVDPYRYLNNGRFDDMPKLLQNSGGDEFFAPDSAEYYFHDIPGENNYLRYFPNTGHGLDISAITSTLTFVYAVLNDIPLPKFSWTVEFDGAIRVQTVDAPSQVLLWQATNPVARDFRRTWNPGITWTSSVLVDQGGGVYVGNPSMPTQGARAYFVELTYPSGIPGVPHKFTTEIHVKSTLPLFDWPFESGFLDAVPVTALSLPTLAQPGLAPLASGLSIAASSSLAASDTQIALPALLPQVEEVESIVEAGPCGVLVDDAKRSDGSDESDESDYDWHSGQVDDELDQALAEMLA